MGTSAQRKNANLKNRPQRKDSRLYSRPVKYPLPPFQPPHRCKIPQGAKLEIESVLRETCDKVLEDPSITPAKANLRAVALQILGEAYMSVRKEDEERKAESEYVRIETAGSARPMPQVRR